MTRQGNWYGVLGLGRMGGALALRRAAELEAVGVNYLDCGSSGGMEGALNGLCLMIGGKPEAFALAEPLFKAISQEGGYAHVGPAAPATS